MSASGTRVAALLAGSAVAGLLAAVVISDVAQEDPDTTPAANAEDAPNQTVRPVPVVESGGAGGALSQAVGLLVLGSPDGETIGGILGTWGAVLADAVEEEPPTSDGEVDDPRLFGAEIGPVFTDPCIDDPDGDGCPDPAEVIPAVVEGDPPLGPNAAVVHAFPRPDAELAAECGFDGLAPDELPIAIATANPGTITLNVGSQTFTDVASEDEIAEFDEWRSTGEVPRPPSSFVAHCLAVPRPTTPGPVIVRVVAVDAGGQTARAETTVVPSQAGLPGPTVTPIDGTMVRVEVPLGPDGDAEVFSVPVGTSIDSLPSCGSGPPSAPATGWRLGSSTLAEEPPSDAAAPYLEASPRVRRVTLALPEGEPSLVCITPVGVEAAPIGLTVVPPDARRLTLAVTSVEAPDGIGDSEDLVVLGTFSPVAWTPCAVVLEDVPSGTMEPGPAGGMCTSGGDTGAIAASGGILDLAIEVADSVHVVRVALSAAPGGDALDVYRLPIPAQGLEGVLCTEGVDQPGCVAPEGDAVLGTIEITALWDEGPTGPANWLVAATP